MNKFEKYKLIKPKHKQIYFNSNIIKGSILGSLTIYVFYIYFNYIFYNVWKINDIRYLGSIYASIDLVSIFKVNKMQINTIIHHVIVQILYFISLFVYQFNVNTLSRGIIFYAFFSTFSFIVNIYLALRLIISDKYKIKLAFISSCVYKICCFLNWIYQIYFIYIINSFIITKLIYISILCGIIYDDIILICFLNKASFLSI